MKPRNWRRYWWYRPPSLNWMRSSAEVREIASVYTNWLAQSRGWTLEQAEEHIAMTRDSGRKVVSTQALLFGEAA